MTTPRNSASPPRRGSDGQPGRSAGDDFEAGARMARAWLGTEDGRRWHQRAADSAGLLKAVLRALSTRHGRDYLRGFAVAATSPGHSTAPVRSSATNGSANGSATGAKRSERLTVGLSEDEDLALKQFGMSDGVAAAARIRAMLLVYRTDPDYRRRVDEVIHPPG
ncbi:hypothetical protein HDA40_001568 [Hamadaea flava]|uniref:Uncharacterized protein n=1 Tax=Hamadaea flava TaxID=1742688 RepID=A0ABV8LPM5_9ACTN|nr:hypothetical protein [Hamadaea flava]MCP2323061.1 hypothetical protein [Hamadaea flava]